jgi:hypothetical protein
LNAAQAKTGGLDWIEGSLIIRTTKDRNGEVDETGDPELIGEKLLGNLHHDDNLIIT